MLNPSNGLSLLRGPLAFLFLVDSTALRMTAVVLAMITDFTDGFLARRFKYSSKLGAILDPAMDKFFVYFVLGVFFMEGSITLPHAALMVSRDLALCVFAIILKLKGAWQAYTCRPVRWGKITTTMQFGIIIALTLGVQLAPYVYWAFALVGIFVLIELINRSKTTLS